MNNVKLKRIILKEVKTVYENQMLNEGILDFFSSIFGAGAGGIIDRLKNTICQKVLSVFGVQSNSLIGKVICNFFENLEIAEIWRVMSGRESACQGIVRELLEALEETLAEEGAERFGFTSNSVLWPIAREAITNSIIRNNQLTSQITQSICSLDFRNLLSSSGASEQSAQRAVSAASDSAGRPPAAVNEMLQERIRRFNRKKMVY